MEKKRENVTYVYDIARTNFYLSKGAIPLELGIHPTTRRVWVMFNHDKTLPFYREWCEREH